MDQVTATKNEFRREQWSRIIQECQNSGQTVVSWCEQNGVNIKSYYYWLRKLRISSMEQAALPVTVSPEKPVSFQKLKVQTPVPDTQAAVIIHLPAATLEIRNGASQQTVEAVLLALKTIC